MSIVLPPGVSIAPPPEELELDSADDSGYARRRYDAPYRRSQLPVQEATAFPVRIVTEAPAVLRSTKAFACSGAVDSSRYQEATRFRTMPEMGWDEARVALNRLLVKTPGEARDYVALAEFALSACGFEGFAGRKGDHAVKLRRQLDHAIKALQQRLRNRLGKLAQHAQTLARPITAHLDGEAWRNNDVLWAKVPTAPDAWVQIIDATPEQTLAALEYLRSLLMTWAAQRPAVDSVVDHLQTVSEPPSAAAYAEALHIVDMLAFVGEKLVMLSAGILHSMPVYRLYPATSEQEAIALWWPWGRRAPLFDGSPPRPPKPRKQVLDPAIITASRPQDVVREVVARTGINRTTAQRMTAAMRAEMRASQRREAQRLLRTGLSKAEVARRVGLSPSRISALIKGKVIQEQSPFRGYGKSLAEI